MEMFTAKIIDSIGLHARPASKIVQIANSFPDNGKLICGNKEADIKSIMSIMALGVKTGEEITIQINGSTAKESLDKLINLMKLEKLI